jgi:hypothetical protein
MWMRKSRMGKKRKSRSMSSTPLVEISSPVGAPTSTGIPQ